MRKRECQRCDGDEYQAMTAAENAGLGGSMRVKEYWYCPRCDWGRQARQDAEE